MKQNREIKEILENLINWNGKLEEIKKSLSSIKWDNDQTFIEFNSTHAINILEKYLASNVNIKELETWANLLESREDIELEPGKEGILKDFIFFLANPDLEGELTVESAIEWKLILSK